MLPRTGSDGRLDEGILVPCGPLVRVIGEAVPVPVPVSIPVPVPVLASISTQLRKCV